MVLPSTGNTISFNDVRIELGISTEAPFSIWYAEAEGVNNTPFYTKNNEMIKINKCDGSPGGQPYPSGDQPASLSEWWNYWHDAPGSTPQGSGGGFDKGTVSCASICADTNPQGTYSLILNSAGTYAYKDAGCRTEQDPGYYADYDRTVCYDIGNSGNPAGYIASVTNC